MRSYGDGVGRGVRVIELDVGKPDSYQTRSIHFDELVAKRLSNPMTGNLSYGSHWIVLRSIGLWAFGTVAAGAAVYAAIRHFRKK